MSCYVLLVAGDVDWLRREFLPRALGDTLLHALGPMHPVRRVPEGELRAYDPADCGTSPGEIISGMGLFCQGARSEVDDSAGAAVGAGGDGAAAVVGDGGDSAVAAVGEGVDSAAAAVGEGVDSADAVMCEGGDRAAAAVREAGESAAAAFGKEGDSAAIGTVMSLHTGMWWGMGDLGHVLVNQRVGNQWCVSATLSGMSEDDSFLYLHVCK
jgi:hypothetical protein